MKERSAVLRDRLRRFRKSHPNYARDKMREYRKRAGWRYGWPSECRRQTRKILGVTVRTDYLRMVKNA